jgi:hypothetical protein
MMAAAVEDNKIRPGMVAVIQTFSDNLKWNPHLHALVTRGGWNVDGQWIPVPYIDAHQAELLFRHKILKMLKKHGLLSDERINLLLSWKHTGFSIDNSVTVYPSDEQGLERLARYLIRSPVSLQRLHYLPAMNRVLYQAKQGHDREPSEIIDPMEFVARVLTHIPDPNRHCIRYFGQYANRAKSKSNKDSTSPEASDENKPTLAPVSKLRRRWADLIRRVYQDDPLTCPKCGSRMRIISFITQHRVIKRILEHLKNRANETRGPPTQESQLAPRPVSP